MMIHDDDTQSNPQTHPSTIASHPSTTFARAVPPAPEPCPTCPLLPRLERTKGYYREQRDEITHLREQVDALELTCQEHQEGSALNEKYIASLEADCERLKRDLAFWERQARFWLDHSEFWRQHAERQGRMPARPAWLAQDLRQLLALAHPDKWSAGQAATTLAHELSVHVNALRARLEGTL